MRVISLDRWFFHSFIPISWRSEESLQKEDRALRAKLVIVGRGILRIKRDLIKSDKLLGEYTAGNTSMTIAEIQHEAEKAQYCVFRAQILGRQREAVWFRRRELAPYIGKTGKGQTHEQ